MIPIDDVKKVTKRYSDFFGMASCGERKLFILFITLTIFLCSCETQRVEYHEFHLVKRMPNSLEMINKPINKEERKTLVYLFSRDGIKYTDSIGKLWFKLPFVDYEPKILMWQYTDLMFDMMAADSIKRLSNE